VAWSWLAALPRPGEPLVAVLTASQALSTRPGQRWPGLFV
jgi:hypothetical protein